jgi:hypothetical protein
MTTITNTNTMTGHFRLITNMCGGDADTATEILKTQTETGVTQFHTCDECHRYCYTGGALYPDSFTCADCDDEESEEDEEEEEDWEGNTPYVPTPRNPAKDAHFALCAERMMAREISCDEAIALHEAAFPSATTSTHSTAATYKQYEMTGRKPDELWTDEETREFRVKIAAHNEEARRRHAERQKKQ